MVRLSSIPGRENPVTPFCAGIVLGAALVAGGVARAEKKPPVLPPARVDYTRPTGPRQALLCGEPKNVEQRANTLLAIGWRVNPASIRVTAGPGGDMIATILLDYKPQLSKSAR